MTEPMVRRARREDRDRLAAMRAMLWPDGSLEEFGEELDAWFSTGLNGTLPGVIFLAEAEPGNLVGFLEAGLRSHADGCDTSRPVGFIEGWFVREGFRGCGIGRKLIEAAEEWARAQRCREMASDALIDNAESVSAHAACGFEEVDRCVHFRKALD